MRGPDLPERGLGLLVGCEVPWMRCPARDVSVSRLPFFSPSMTTNRKWGWSASRAVRSGDRDT